MIIVGGALAMAVDAELCEIGPPQDSNHGPNKVGRSLGYPLLGHG